MITNDELMRILIDLGYDLDLRHPEAFADHVFDYIMSLID